MDPKARAKAAAERAAARGEINRARSARVPYVHPRDIGDGDGRRIRMPAAESLAESYLSQVHTRVDGGRRRVLRPLPAEPAPSQDLSNARWLITAWNPVGRHCSLRENEGASQRLIARVVRVGGAIARTLATTPPTRAWLEDTLLVSGLDRPTVVGLAVEFEQPAVTAWTAAALVILPTGLTGEVAPASLGWVEQIVPLTCPMRSDDIPGERCILHGGPFISASMHAAAIWRDHRRLLTSRLLCEPCDDGRGPTLGPYGAGGVITLSDVLLGSRYGGYAWPNRPLRISD